MRCSKFVRVSDGKAISTLCARQGLCVHNDMSYCTSITSAHTVLILKYTVSLACVRQLSW